MSDPLSQWYYTPVQHAGYVAVHSAEYDANGTLLSIDTTEQDLRDLSREHLVNFLSAVLNGVVNKAVVSPEQYAAKVRVPVRP
jgi:hypothetical protein